jgi:hypothetical protein
LSIIAVSRSNDARKAAQCSRSAACRGDLVDRLELADGVRQQPGDRRADHQVLHRAGGGDLLLDPVELGVAEHEVLAVLEDAPVAGVDHDEAAVAEVPAKAEPHPFRTVGLGVGAVGELDEQRPRVAVVLEDLAVVGVGGELVGTEVADVLVHPVRGEPGADAVAPPRRTAHLVAPRR